MKKMFMLAIIALGFGANMLACNCGSAKRPAQGPTNTLNR